MDRPLKIAAIAEAATGLALFLVPSAVSELLLGAPLDGIAAAIARVAGIALVGLGIACWPGLQRAGMLTYGAGVALYLAWLGLAGGLAGPLLWPAVGVHAILAALLAAPRRQAARSNIP